MLNHCSPPTPYKAELGSWQGTCRVVCVLGDNGCRLQRLPVPGARETSKAHSTRCGCLGAVKEGTKAWRRDRV